MSLPCSWRLALLLIGLVAMLAAHSVWAGKVYRWTDEHGQIQFSDRAPHNASAQEVKIPTFTGAAEISTAAATGGRGVKLYTTKSCGYCKRAKAYLDSRRIAYTDLDVETNRSAQADFTRLNGRGVPLIFVGDQRMDGYSEDGLARLLKKAGY